MKKILVPTDFSKYADSALKFAAAFAEKTHAEIILLHAFDVPYSNAYTSYEEYGREMESAKHDSDKKLKAQLSRLGIKKLPHALLSVHEYTSDAILKSAEANHIDLIIMGSKGVSNLPQRIIGTNAAEIVEKAKCPVFVVPQNCTYNGLGKVVMATTCKESDLALLEKLARIFKPLRPHLHLVNVAEKNKDEAKAEMNDFAGRAAARTGIREIPHVVLPAGDVEEKLEAFITQRSIDLLVVSPGHHNVFGKLFGQSVSRKMALRTETPLLALH